MSVRTLNLTKKLYEYLLEAGLRDDPKLRRVREATARHPAAGMQISPEQGQFMAFLVRLIGARRCIELGTFTGYSALCVALALPPDGKLICCDVNESTTSQARRFWAEAGVADKIDLRLAPALETLDGLLAGRGGKGSFDFAFIDADKDNYEAYYERCLELLRPGGLMAIDNVLWDGEVAEARSRDPTAQMFRRLNAKIRDDVRVDMSLLPLGDGVMLARRRET